MKLEPELLKMILVWCEENLPDDKGSWDDSSLNFKQFTRQQIQFHAKLLCENGYLDYIDTSTQSGFSCILNHLTMNGYQYLHLMKSKAWNIAKGLVHEVGVIFSEAAIKAVIEKYTPPR